MSWDIPRVAQCHTRWGRDVRETTVQRSYRGAASTTQTRCRWDWAAGCWRRYRPARRSNLASNSTRCDSARYRSRPADTTTTTTTDCCHWTLLPPTTSVHRSTPESLSGSTDIAQLSPPTSTSVVVAFVLAHSWRWTTSHRPRCWHWSPTTWHDFRFNSSLDGTSLDWTLLTSTVHH